MRDFLFRIRRALEALSRARKPVRLIQRQPIGDDGALDVADGDILVVRCAAHPTEEMRQTLERQFLAALPRRVRILVLGPGIDFDVLTAAPARDSGEA
ncbi:hypothetical protein [Burkholderia gladioli]|uniref:hypothetical protein n=1 Tax=Burkholderia gladioli TaxID=28095 RepID=UPI002FDFC725